MTKATSTALSSTVSTTELQEEETDENLVFSTIAKFFDGLRAQDGDFFVLQGLICNTSFTDPRMILANYANGTGVSQDTFQSIKAARDRRGSKIRFHYHPERKELLVTLPKMPHELVRAEMNIGLYHNLRQMGLSDNDLWPALATEFSGNDGSSGEPDACFLPPERGRDPGGWPTLVLETGVSQSLESTRAKMRWWFSASDHAVKIVVVCKVWLDARRLLIERYTKDKSQTQDGATSTRNMPSLTPRLRQSINITAQPGSDPVVYNVVGGPLIIEFSLLFLRPADPARGEGDIILDASWLEQLARRIWARS